MITNVAIDTNSTVPYNYSGEINGYNTTGQVGVTNNEISFMDLLVTDSSANTLGKISYGAPLGVHNGVSLSLSAFHSDLNNLMEVFQGVYADLQASEVIHPENN